MGEILFRVYCSFASFYDEGQTKLSVKKNEL
jgi:hypothetical protein